MTKENNKQHDVVNTDDLGRGSESAEPETNDNLSYTNQLSSTETLASKTEVDQTIFKQYETDAALFVSDKITKILTYEQLIGDAYNIDSDDIIIQHVELCDDRYGSLIDNNDGTLIYTPNEDFSREVAFRYKLYDGHSITSLTSILKVADIQDAPRTSGPIVLSAGKNINVTFTVQALCDTMTDIDSTMLQHVSLAYNGIYGTLTDIGNRAYTFSSNENFHGGLSLDFIMQYGEQALTEYTRVTFALVHDLTEFSAAPNFTLCEDGSVQISPIALLNSAPDTYGSVLSIVDLELADPSQGRLITTRCGNFNFIPNEHFNGDMQLNYQVFDGAESVAHTAEVFVASGDDSTGFDRNHKATQQSVSIDAERLSILQDTESDPLSWGVNDRLNDGVDDWDNFNCCNEFEPINDMNRLHNQQDTGSGLGDHF